MTGELFGAEQMEAWNVVNRVFENGDFERETRSLVEKLAAGPTKAHAMTKHVVRRYVQGGVAAADDAIRTDAGDLFATADLQRAVETFLERGPGHAEFDNR
jgi:enoyl-CoA hydratase/carnithine racemase